MKSPQAHGSGPFTLSVSTTIGNTTRHTSPVFFPEPKIIRHLLGVCWCLKLIGKEVLGLVTFLKKTLEVVGAKRFWFLRFPV